MVPRNTPKIILPSINTDEDVSSSPPLFSPLFRWPALFSEAVIDASDLVTRSTYDWFCASQPQSPTALISPADPSLLSGDYSHGNAGGL